MDNQTGMGPTADSARDHSQAAYAAQLRFLGVMHRLQLPVTAGAVRPMPHGGYGVRLGTIATAALDRLSAVLEEAAHAAHRIDPATATETGCVE